MKKKLSKKEQKKLEAKKIEIQWQVFNLMIKTMFPHGGISMDFPYRNEKGELRYAKIRATDIFNKIKW